MLKVLHDPQFMAHLMWMSHLMVSFLLILMSRLPYVLGIMTYLGIMNNVVGCLMISRFIVVGFVHGLDSAGLDSAGKDSRKLNFQLMHAVRLLNDVL